MKVIPIALLNHMRQDVTTLANLFRIERTDGQVFAYTDHDATIIYDGTAYKPTNAFDASAVQTKSDLSVDNLEVHGNLTTDDGITAESVERGLWDGAHVLFMRVNWANTSQGAEMRRFGELGNISRKQVGYQAEILGPMAKLRNNILRLFTPSCDAQLGDARCKVNLDGTSEEFRHNGEIALIYGEKNTAFSSSGMPATEAYFDGGVVLFTSGNNAGISMEVKAFTDGENFSLQLPMPFDLQVGDTFVATAGCDKTKATCINKFDNVVNFRGFSFIPGQDRVLLVGGQ